MVSATPVAQDPLTLAPAFYQARASLDLSIRREDPGHFLYLNQDHHVFSRYDDTNSRIF